MKQVKLPVDHFRKVAKREYADWQSAIIREFVQNGVDAGSSRIDFLQQENILSVANDGRSMDLDTCENVLLTLGGTNKTEYDVGGFAKAKEILYFPWERWEIRSQDYKILGVGCYYEIHKADPIVGVQSVLHLEEEIPKYKFQEFIGRCQTYARISFNGEIIPTHIPRGKRIRDLGWAILYKRKTLGGDPVHGDRIWVRSHGVPMFFVWLGDLDCVLHLELQGDTKSLMTSNRDGLKEPYRSELDKNSREIIVNIRKNLSDEDSIIVQKIIGSGHTHVTKEAPQEKEPHTEAAKNQTPAIEDSPQLPFVPQPLTSALPLDYLPDSYASVRHPDILIKAKGHKSIPKKHHPESWCYRSKAILVLWNKILTQIFKDNKIHCSYGIGFILDEDHSALYMTHEGIPHFLINPEIKKDSKHWKFGFRLSGKQKELMIMDMKQKAIHEVAHYVSGSDHNEDFIGILETLEANTWKNIRAYKLIGKMKKIDF